MTVRGFFLTGLLAASAGCVTPLAPLPDAEPMALLPDRPAPARPDAEAPRGPWTLEACLRRAMDADRGLRISDRQAIHARARLTESWSVVLPKVKAEGRWQTRSNDFGNVINGAEAVFGERETTTGKLSAIVPLYSFGRAEAQLDAEMRKIDAAELDADRHRQDLAYLVSGAYYRVLEARRIREVVAQSLQVVERQLAIARDFLAQGLVARNDVLAAEVQLAGRRQEQIAADNNVELAVAGLNRLMVRDPDAPLDLADVLEVEPWRGSYASAVRMAVEKRPDLAALKTRIEALRAEFRFARAGQMPVIYAFGDLNYSSDDTLLHQEWMTGGLAIEMPLFDGLAAWAAMRKKELEIEDAVDRHDSRVEDAILGIKEATLDVREAAERIPVARKSIEQAEENLRVVRDQYGEGLVTTADVLFEEDRLSRARSGYFQSLYGYHAAFARLTNVIGGTPPAE